VLLGENGTGKTTFIKMLAEAGKKKEKKKEGDKEEKKYDVNHKKYRSPR
jgi:ABC-type multidrug transport system ATPase subunit